MVQETIVTSPEITKLITIIIPAFAALGGTLLGVIGTYFVTRLNNKHNEKMRALEFKNAEKARKEDRIFHIKHRIYSEFVYVGEKIKSLHKNLKKEDKTYAEMCYEVDDLFDEFLFNLSPLELYVPDGIYDNIEKIKNTINETRINFKKFNNIIQLFDLENSIDRKEVKKLSDEENNSFHTAFKSFELSAQKLQEEFKELLIKMRKDLQSHHT